VDKDTSSYSRVMQELVKAAWCNAQRACCKPAAYLLGCRSLSYFENTALFPLTDLFQRLLRFQTEDTPDEKLGKLEHALSQYRLPVEDTVPLFAPLLVLPLLNIAILRSICHHNVNAKRRWKLSSPSSWNLLNISLYSLSWKTCTGRTHRPLVSQPAHRANTDASLLVLLTCRLISNPVGATGPMSVR